MGKAWNFYRRALNESIATYGEESEALIPALEGMVRAQYLLAGHRGIGAAMPGKMDRDATNYAAGKATFKRGLSVLVATSSSIEIAWCKSGDSGGKTFSGWATGRGGPAIE